MSKKATACCEQATAVKRSKPSITPACERVRTPKKAICLSYLYRRSLTELEALSLYHDTCLHSTISDLYNNNGIVFKRVKEAHPHSGGGTVYFTRYTLEPESRKAAATLLKHYGINVDEFAESDSAA
jgi:hypothetical protein